MQLILLHRQFGADGALLAGGKAFFYLTGGTTLATVYEDEALGVAHPNPVVASADGLFPPIYLDQAVTYRLKLTDSSGDTSSPIEDIDPLNGTDSSIGTSDLQDEAVTAAKCDPNLVADLLGYTPVNTAGDTMTDHLRLDYPAAPASLPADAAGYLGAPATTQDANYTLALADAGAGLRHTSASAHTYAIPPASSVNFPDGTMIPIRNVGAGALSVTRGAGVTLRPIGLSTNADVTVAQHGFLVLQKDTSDSWYYSGAGVS